MTSDLKYIKKKYGEEMMHLCRKEFSTILETNGTLTSIISNLFFPSKMLYKDLEKYNLIDEFVKYLYSKIEIIKEEERQENTLSLEELFSKASYDLYRCRCENDIQRFKKYYRSDEKLCTFYGGRLNSCFVYFAVKKNAKEIKREDFIKPVREDLYGTSVISIQINRNNHYLSIKNRYNHTVSNPDATFSNNLDNIVPGLTRSFEKELGFSINNVSKQKFEIPNYVVATDGKFYKYNFERNNIYYCPNNVVIKDFKAKQFDKSKYVLIQDKLLDLVNKKVISIDCENGSSFLDGVGEINQITITKDRNKIINIDDEIIIELDDDSNIIKYIDNRTTSIKDNFLVYDKTIEYLRMDKVATVMRNFLKDNNSIKKVILVNARIIGDNFLTNNNSLISLVLPEVRIIGNNFLENNNTLGKLNLKEARQIGGSFLRNNQCLRELYLQELRYIEDDYLLNCSSLEKLVVNESFMDRFINCNKYLKDKYNFPRDIKVKVKR